MRRSSETVVGWDADAIAALVGRACGAVGAPAPEITDEPPRTKPGCAAKSTYDEETLALMERAGAADEMEDMFERGWTDGLPVVPPTRSRVEAMLGGRDPHRSLGEVPPGMGEATVERVAACAVLAGCRPEYFPVVLAAVEAALDPAFNVGGQAVTTQPAGQLVIVSGPIRDSIGVHSGMGVLGPGWRANLTIGRALRLVVTLTGGGVPGRLDRSTLGHPGKLGFCIAEDEAGSPWEPLHVERGFAREDSVVTVVGCDAPLSISDHRATTPLDLAYVLGWAGAATWSPNWWPLGGTSVYIICPEHQAMFGAAGWDKQQLREAMFDAVRRPARDLRRGETTPQVHAADPETLVRKWDSPEDIVLVAAGGEAGRYSAVLGPCLGMSTQMVVPGGRMEYVSPFDERRRAPEPLAPRRDTLRGARVAVLDITKRRGDEFLDRVEARLRAQGAETFRVAKEIFSKPAEPELIRRIANRGDLAVEGLAD